jgi:hypothetical protein
METPGQVPASLYGEGLRRLHALALVLWTCGTVMWALWQVPAPLRSTDTPTPRALP